MIYFFQAIRCARCNKEPIIWNIRIIYLEKGYSLSEKSLKLIQKEKVNSTKATPH